MISAPNNISVNLQKNVPLEVNIPVYSSYNAPKEVTVRGSCTCTTSSPTATVDPQKETDIKVTLNRGLSGTVKVYITLDSEILEVNLNTTVN